MDRRWALHLLLALAVLISAGCSPASSKPAPVVTVAAGTQIFEVDGTGRGDVVALDPATGRRLRSVAPAHVGNYRAVSVSRFFDHTLLVAYARGPECSSGIAGCGPRPYTCGGRLLEVDDSSGHVKHRWSIPDNTYLRSATAPVHGDGRVALVIAPCVPSYFNQHIEIRQLNTGRHFEIGDAAPRCHGLGGPAWIDDDRRLFLRYAPPTDPNYHGADGICPEVGSPSLIRVQSDRSQPDLPSPGTYADPGCSFTSISAAGSAIYAIEGCGPGNGLTGSANLVRLSMAGRITARWPLAKCPNGNDLAISAAGTVFISGYFYCGGGHPVTRLFRLEANQLHAVRTIPGGNLAVASPTW
jgi:hypothetical protein